MAAILNVDASLRVKMGLTAFVMAGKSCFCKNKVKLCKKLQIQRQYLGIGGQFIAQGSQNSLNLLLLLDLQGAQLII